MLGSAAYDGIAGVDRAASSGETTGLDGCADGIGLDVKGLPVVKTKKRAVYGAWCQPARV